MNVVRFRIALPACVEAALLARDLSRPDSDLQAVSTPSWDEALATLIERRSDAALVSPVAVGRTAADLTLLPQLALSARGSCPSQRLHLFSRLENVRTCGDATSGHAASAVARLAFEASGRSDVEFVPFSGGAGDALGEHEAVITAGDGALCEETPEEATALDLGDAWSLISGTPLVWGVVAARRESAGEIARRLESALEPPAAAAAEIAAQLAAREGCSRDHVFDYLTRVVRRDVDDGVRRGAAELCSLARAVPGSTPPALPNWL
jgi:predicted solute-binding protein